ncbi:MAG: bifunctional UDP-N-acetylglucosamine diphosphorylase/glucosamine-1-phosphate N-acetyltransferase GlmU [Nitriliruptoraceae bacterium]
MSTSPFSAPDVAAVVLAAGRGTRFRSDLVKVLHRAAGRTLVRHVLEALRPLGLGQVVVVVGPDAHDVRAEIEDSGLPVHIAVQEQPLGTGHAVQQAVPVLDPGIRRVLVLPGDTPLLTGGVLAGLVEASDAPSTLAMLTTRLADPSGYGRVLRSGDGTVAGIVEHADASDEQRAIDEVNAGMYVVPADTLADALARLDDDNAQGEVYLTDVVALAVDAGCRVVAVDAPADAVAGVNDRRQLAEVSAVLRRRHLDHLMVDVGVTVVDPATTHVDVDVEVGVDSTLLPGTILEAGTRIGRGCVVGPHTHLTRCVVGDGATVHSTRGTDAVVGASASVGPFAHLRAGTVLGAGGRIGAYVETKNARVGDGSKIPHLSYVGDAVIGSGVNVACGVVTVNYDGQDKHVTTIDDDAFVGCDTMLVAPVTIGAGAYVAAGSVITDDVPAGALAIARARQVVKEGWVDRRRTRRSGDGDDEPPR